MKLVNDQRMQENVNLTKEYVASKAIQVATIPTASSSLVGKLYQYTGTTTNTYTHGYFYECVENSGVYSWENVPVGAGDIQIQSDWNQTDNTQKDYIKNKPTIPSAQVNSDWTASSGVAEILHKPTLGTASALDVATSGNASTSQVVKGDDTRLTDSRNAADVYSWAKAENKPSYTASEVGAIASIDKGANNGVAELDSTGKVPSSQLPSYVDDVLEYNSQSAFPSTGETGKIYIAKDTNKSYRWSGTAYVEISESLALGETSSTAYAGNKGKANADAISAIKDGSTIDSFGDVESALSDKISKSSTAGLVKNDGTIDTTSYVSDISGKADKVSSATNNNFAALDANGNLKDSGHKHSDYLTQHQDISGKADKVSGATSGNVATLDANGNLVDSNKTLGKSVPSDAVFTDTNTKVTQTNTTGSADYRVLLSENANDTTQTVGARKSTNFKANPSTGVLSTPKVKISKSANALITGSGTAGSDKGSGVSPRYYPAKWTFNLGGDPNDGDIITIKIPVAGGTYSEWLSTDNGITYHPIALNGKSRITSQYAVNTYLTLIYESSGVCTTYALAGADSTADVTGTWRVINYYDSNTTYSSMSQSEANTGTSTTGRLITAKVLNDTISNKTSDKADKAVPSASGNVATLDANGNLTDSEMTLGKSVPSTAKFSDSNVGQYNTVDSNDYRILLSYSANDDAETGGVRKSSKLKFNHDTGNLQVPKINGVTVGSSPKFTDTDTKNTAGSTDSNNKLFLIGATSQAANPQTYSQDTAYVGTDGNLYSGSKVVATQNMIGDAWVTSHAYAVGDYCIDGNVLYKCKTAHTSSASYRPPYASYWDAVSVTSQLKRIEGFTELSYTASIDIQNSILSNAKEIILCNLIFGFNVHFYDFMPDVTSYGVSHPWYGKIQSCCYTASTDSTIVYYSVMYYWNRQRGSIASRNILNTHSGWVESQCIPSKIFYKL